jgi:tight adherence protein B
MTFALLMLMIFLAASLGVAATWLVVLDLTYQDERQARRRLNEEFASAANVGDTLIDSKPRLFKDIEQIVASAALAGDGNEHKGKRNREGWAKRLEQLLARAGLTVSPYGLLRVSVILASGLGVAGVLLAGLLGAAIGFLLGAFLPLGYVWYKARAREEQLRMQLPAAFDLMARVLRAGHSVPQAFQAVSDSFEPPICTEFAHCREQQKLGLLPELAFADLAERSQLLEMKIFALAMMVQRQTGGNLSEVLDRLANLIRARVRLHAQVRTLTAEGRLQAVVLLVLPGLMFLAMRMVNRQYADTLLDYPWMIAGTAVMMAVGALWIRKVVEIKV